MGVLGNENLVFHKLLLGECFHLVGVVNTSNVGKECQSSIRYEVEVAGVKGAC